MVSIRKSPPANTIATPSPQFEKQLFDAAIWQKGYDCYVEKAIECPCRGDAENHSPVPSCQNCGGIGWVFINPVQTIALITGVNRDTKYKQWSQELIGNVSISLRDVEQAGFMDRITLLNETAIFSEVKKIKSIQEGLETSYFTFLSYEIKQIEDVYTYKGNSVKLNRVNPDLYDINQENKACLLIDSDVIPNSTNNTISVRYKHPVQYHILDIPHIIRSSTVTNGVGAIEKIKMPNQYVARLAHNVLRPLFDGTGIIDNSFEE